MDETSFVFIAGFGLLGIGWYGLLVTRHVLRLIAILQIMGKGVILLLVAGGKLGGNAALGQSLAVSVITVDTMVAVVALALAVQIYRHNKTMDIRHLAQLKG